MEGKRVSTVLVAKFKACGKLADGKIRNLSLGGLFVGTKSIPPTGETVRVRFRLSRSRHRSPWWARPT